MLVRSEGNAHANSPRTHLEAERRAEAENYKERRRKKKENHFVIFDELKSKQKKTKQYGQRS